jgi:hypothetical protein
VSDTIIQKKSIAGRRAWLFHHTGVIAARRKGTGEIGKVNNKINRRLVGCGISGGGKTIASEKNRIMKLWL